MSYKKEILREYDDIISWLAEISVKNFDLFNEIQDDAISVTAKHFSQSFDYVESLVAETQFQYSADEEPIVRFFHEYLRKIRDSNQ